MVALHGPLVTSEGYGCLVRMRYAINLWIRLSLSHPFFKHDNITYFVTLRVGAVKCDRPSLSIA